MKGVELPFCGYFFRTGKSDSLEVLLRQVFQQGQIIEHLVNTLKTPSIGDMLKFAFERLKIGKVLFHVQIR